MDEEKLARIHFALDDLYVPDNETRAGIQDALENQPDYLKEKIDQERAKTKKVLEEVECLKDDRRARKLYGMIVFSFVAAYILGVLWIFVHYRHFAISDQAIMALLGTTTLNVIGLLAVVVRYLFPTKNK